MAMTTMAVRSARNGKVVLSSWLINKSNNNKKSAIFWRAASSSSIPKIDGDKDKKIREEERRLSAVIDAVNDRKLPPELRGQRNSVRLVPSCSLLPAFIICNTNNSCSFCYYYYYYLAGKIKSVVWSSFIEVLRFCITTTTCYLLCSTFNAPSKKTGPCRGDAGGAWG